MHEQKIAALKTLKGADYNPRVMPEGELEKLKQSIKEFGWVQSVVVRKEDGLIVGGHQRVMAYRELLKEQGLSELEIGAAPVPVTYVAGLDDSKTKLLNVALNKIHGEWDSDKLAALFSSLTVDAPVELSGFSKDEVDGMLSMASTPIQLTTLANVAQDVEAAMPSVSRRFNFEVATDEEAALCNEALRQLGMKTPEDATAAFLSMVRMFMGVE
jgi:ParB-like chromosome segregation protein Spo0J